MAEITPEELDNDVIETFKVDLAPVNNKLDEIASILNELDSKVQGEGTMKADLINALIKEGIEVPEGLEWKELIDLLNEQLGLQSTIDELQSEKDSIQIENSENKQQLIDALVNKGFNCSIDNSWDEIVEIINTPLEVACSGSDNQYLITDKGTNTNQYITVQCIEPICFNGTEIGDLLHGREINFYCFLHSYNNSATVRLYADDEVVCTITSTATTSAKSSTRIIFNKYATYKATLVNGYDTYRAYFSSAGWEYNIVTI